MKLTQLLSRLFGLTLLAVPTQAGSIIFHDDFDNYSTTKSHFGDTTQYKLVTDSGRSAIKVQVLDSTKAIYLSYPLPLDSVRGSVIQITATTRAQDLTRKSNPWTGVKVMVSVKRADGTADNPQCRWPDSLKAYGWQSGSMIVTIPDSAIQANLVLGLEVVAGTVLFDSLRVERIGSVKQPPARTAGIPIPHAFGPANSRGAMIGVPADSAALVNFGTNWKGNFLRWQMNGPYGLAFVLNQTNYETLLQSEFGYLDKALPICRANGIRVIIDMHQMSTGLFLGTAQQSLLIATWKRIVQRYGGNPAVAGYDLANEPNEATWNNGALLWNELVDTLCRVIRSVDPITPIVVEPVNGDVARFVQTIPAGSIRGWDIANLVYSFHFYQPATLTAQGVDATSRPIGAVYPATIDGIAYDSIMLRQAMQPAVDFQNRYRLPIYVGEFSCIRWAPQHSALHWLTDVTNILESQGWDWTYHAYREYQGWSVEYSDSLADMRSNLNTDRKALLLGWYAKNTNPYTAIKRIMAPSFQARELKWHRIGVHQVLVEGIPEGSQLEIRRPNGTTLGNFPAGANFFTFNAGVYWYRVTGRVSTAWLVMPIIP